MAQFPARQDVLKNWTACNWSDQISVDIPREFFLENLILQFEVTSGATPPVIATNKEGFAAICDEIRLEVLAGSTQRSPIRTTSSLALQKHRNLGGGLDRHTTYLIDTSISTTFVAGDVNYMSIPISPVPVNLDDPAASLFLLPLPRYAANPQLRFNITAGANVVTVPGNVTLRYRILMNRRFVSDAAFPVYDTEENFIDTAFTSAADNLAIEIPAPGVFTYLMGQCYDVTDFRTPVSLIKAKGYTQATGTGNTGGLAWTTADKFLDLKFLGTSIRRANPFDLQVIADFSTDKAAGLAQPNQGSTSSNVWFWDFLSDKLGSTAQDFGSTLDTNPLVGQGARVNLLVSPTLPGGSKLRLGYHRVFGDVSPLKRALPAAKGK